MANPVSPQQAASAPAQTASAPAIVKVDPATKAVTLPLPAGTTALTLQLPPKAPDDLYWGLEAAMWSGILTAAATVFAVLVTAGFTNRNTTRQLNEARDLAKTEQEQDKKQAHSDRVTAARREIYGEVMADFQRVQAFIGGMAGEGYKPADSLILSMMSASVNKLWIWGEVESAYAVREFYSQVNEFYHAALAKALPIHKARNLVAKVTAGAAQQESEKVRLERELNAHHSIAKEERDDAWTAKANRLDQESQMASRNASEQRRVVAGMDFGISIKADEFLDFLIEQQTALMDQINVVMRLARADIGMEGDVRKLEEQSHEMSNRATAAVRKLKEDIQKEAESLQHLFR